MDGWMDGKVGKLLMMMTMMMMTARIFFALLIKDLFISRSYWRNVVRLTVRLSVCPSVCNAVHYGSQGRSTGLKVVPACS